MATTLSSYITTVRRLLRDSSGKYYTDAQLTDYINTARSAVCADTKCNRQLQTINLSQGLERYNYGSVTGFIVNAGGTGFITTPNVVLTPAVGDPGAGAAGTATLSAGAVSVINATAGGSSYLAAPSVSFSGGGGVNANASATIVQANTYDILNVYLTWGNTRFQLDWMAFSEFSTKIRRWTTFPSRPTVFSTYGQGAFFVGPVPDQPYICELDTSLNPTALVNSTDVESSIAFPYTEPVAYYAAFVAKLQEQSMEDSKKFDLLYSKMIARAVGRSFTRRLPSMYRA